jgi:KipI family sensor histidine kinase inhibitor
VISLEPRGDRAFLARFDGEDEARGWNFAVRDADLPGVLDVVLAYRSVAVFADPDRTDLDALAGTLEAIGSDPASEDEGRIVTIPVLYDGEDLEEVAHRLGKPVGDVIDLHAGREYRVLAVGFLPGFPYAGNLAEELAGLPRRERPRPRVPAGAVAIAGRQTGIYPRESPGGWNLLGRTPLRIADPDRGLFPIRAGDRLRFAPIEFTEYRDRLGEWLAVTSAGSKA